MQQTQDGGAAEQASSAAKDSSVPDHTKEEIRDEKDKERGE